MYPMKILLIGGTGLVGEDVRKQLLQSNNQIIATSRNYHESNCSNLTWIKIDFYNPNNNLFEQLPIVDVVIHNASAIMADTFEDVANLQKCNIQFSEKLYEWATSIKVQKIILLSSFSFIQKPLPVLITENSTVAPVTFYAMTKYWQELLLREYSKAHSFQKIIFRISSPICNDISRLHNTVVKKMIYAAKNGNEIHVMGQGLREQNFISTIDIADIVNKSIYNAKVNGVYNIGSEATISMKRLAELIANKFNVSIKFEDIDILEDERWNISIEKAKKELEFTPTFQTSEDVIMNLLENS